jgi:hypothetical protein
MKRTELEKIKAGVSVKDVMPQLKAIVTKAAAAFPGRVQVYDSYVGDITMNVEYAFAVSCSLYVRVDKWEGETIRVADAEGRMLESYRKVRIFCEVNWSATSRPIREAMACVNLYKEITDLAVKVEAIAEGFGIIYRKEEYQTPAAAAEKITV